LSSSAAFHKFFHKKFILKSLIRNNLNTGCPSERMLSEIIENLKINCLSQRCSSEGLDVWFEKIIISGLFFYAIHFQTA